LRPLGVLESGWFPPALPGSACVAIVCLVWPHLPYFACIPFLHLLVSGIRRLWFVSASFFLHLSSLIPCVVLLPLARFLVILRSPSCFLCCPVSCLPLLIRLRLAADDLSCYGYLPVPLSPSRSPLRAPAPWCALGYCLLRESGSSSVHPFSWDASSPRVVAALARSSLLFSFPFVLALRGHHSLASSSGLHFVVCASSCLGALVSVALISCCALLPSSYVHARIAGGPGRRLSFSYLLCKKLIPGGGRMCPESLGKPFLTTYGACSWFPLIFRKVCTV